MKKLFIILLLSVACTHSLDKVLKPVSTLAKLKDRNIQARIYADSTILNGASVAYFFDHDTITKFKDSSPNHRDITAIPASDPIRDSIGIHFTGSQNLTLPNRPYQCYILAMKLTSGATGMVYRATNGSTSIDLNLTATSGVYHSTPDPRKNGAVDPLTAISMKTGAWLVGTFSTSAVPGATPVRIGSNGTTYKLNGGDFAAVVGLEYQPTEAQIQDWHNYITARLLARGINIPSIQLPPLITNIIPRATHPLDSIVSTAVATPDNFAELSAVDIETTGGCGAKYAGYRFWLVGAPYITNNAVENAHIFATNDATRQKWVTPTGVTNPVIPKPTGGNNSDPTLVYDPSDSTMYMYNRKTVGANTWTQVISSQDGFVTHTAVADLFLETGMDNDPGTEVSPMVYYNPHTQKWTLMSILIGFHTNNRNIFTKRTSDYPDGPYSDPTQCTMPDTDWTPWHGNAVWDDYLDCAVIFTSVNVVGSNGSGAVKSKFYTSVDEDNTWYQCREYNLTTNANAQLWDGTRVYRTALMRTPGGYNIIYVGSGKWPETTGAARYRLGTTSFTF